MCLEVKRKGILNWFGILTLKTAKKDIICYKTYFKINNKKVMSVVQGTYHDLGLQPKVKFSKESFKKFFSIYKGYHSYIKKPKSKKFNNEVTYKCIIPKGAKYLKGGINTNYGIDGYVSNKIIIVEEIKDELL